MKTLITVIVTLLVVGFGVAITWFYVKAKADGEQAEKSAAEQRIRDLYGDDVIIG